jgi:CheY-like chemotaxis protein
MRYSVLVVDDDPILAELYAQMLVNAGFEVTRTRSVRDALTALETREFSAILSDVRLPEADGLSFYRSVEKKFPAAAARFGFCTAWDDPSTREFAAEHRIPVLRKPCRAEAVEAFVMGLIRP